MVAANVCDPDTFPDLIPNFTQFKIKIEIETQFITIFDHIHNYTYIYTYPPDRFVSLREEHQHTIYTLQFGFVTIYFHSINHFHLTSANYTNYIKVESAHILITGYITFLMIR